MYPQKPRQVPLWQELLQLQPPQSKAWMLMEDFNNILTLRVKLGGTHLHHCYMNNFMAFLNSAGLISTSSTGNMCTWCNYQDYPFRIYERLDRVLTKGPVLYLDFYDILLKPVTVISICFP